MLYMAFVTIANYSQASFEMGYALKFMRVILLVLTSLFNLWGFIAGTVLCVCAVAFNKTIAGKSYIYPLIPFSWSECKKRFFRGRSRISRHLPPPYPDALPLQSARSGA